MSDQRYEFLIDAHEVIEAYLAIHAGISLRPLTGFNKAYEAKRKPGDISETGADPRAPYHKQHLLAEQVERLLARQLGVDCRLTIARCRASDRRLTPRGRKSRSNCKLVFPNNALVAVSLTLDAVLERVSCYGEEANDREEVASGV